MIMPMTIFGTFRRKEAEEIETDLLKSYGIKIKQKWKNSKSPKNNTTK
jgi:hypothetical protein